MGIPYEQNLRIIDATHPALGKPCPKCGEVFELGDVGLRDPQAAASLARGEVIVIHVQCAQPREGEVGTQS
jgi:hypothetical protein